MDKVEGKTAAEESRKRIEVLNRYLHPDKKPKGQYADPALLFS